jgi:hypothetical protein
VSKRLTFLVRRSPSHAVVVHVSIRDTPEGQRMFLLRLSQDAGPVPDVSDLIGVPFATRSDLRTAIKARMRALDPTPVSGADRVRAHAERQRERGLKQVREWIPAEMETEFRDIARKMRDDR